MAPRRLLPPTAVPSLSRRLSERARHLAETRNAGPQGAEAPEGMREKMRNIMENLQAVPAAAAAVEAGWSVRAPGEAVPRVPRATPRQDAEGWNVQVELPGTPPEAVTVMVEEGVLLVAAAGSFIYAARLPLPAGLDAKTLQWNCVNGLLYARLSAAATDPEMPA